MNRQTQTTVSERNGTGEKWAVRLLALFIAGILAFSFLGKLIQSDFGSIHVEHVLIDVRGGVMDGQLYYPAGTSSQEKLPAVVIAHGGGMNYGAMRGSAAEIARRGFVVLSLSAYGSSLSLMPPYDETGNGVEVFNLLGDEGASAGLFDAVDYVRSMAIVDPTRVGLLGQSMGANRAGAAAVIDCGYYTFNDILINLLYDTFGQRFTEEEIAMDADTLAAQRLNQDQLTYYQALREQAWEKFDTRLKGVMVVGLNWLPPLSPSKDVEVAGYTVTRNVQTNVAYGTGSLDVWRTINQDETIKSTWYSQSDITYGSWYSIDDQTKTNTILGDFDNSSVTEDEALALAIENGTARVLCQPVENVTHTGICLSTGLFSQQTKFFEQTLGYNRGDLGAEGTTPLDAGETYGIWREICNGLAMICMVGMVITLGILLLKTPLFHGCVAQAASTPLSFSRKQYLLSCGATFLLTFAAIVYINKGINGFALSEMFLSPVLPFGQGTLLAIAFVLILAVGTVVIVAANAMVLRKKTGRTGLENLNIAIGGARLGKTLLLALTLLASAYISLGVIDYLFGQDYRYFTMYFSYVRPEYWIRLLPTIAIFFGAYLIIGVGVNYLSRGDGPQWKDTLMTVVIFSAGVWVACIINEVGAISAGAAGTFDNSTSFFCNFMNTYHFNFTVPMVALISRVLYKRTHSIWLGALVCALLVAWSATGSGTNDMYMPQTFLSSLLG